MCCLRPTDAMLSQQLCLLAVAVIVCLLPAHAAPTPAPTGSLHAAHLAKVSATPAPTAPTSAPISSTVNSKVRQPAVATPDVVFVPSTRAPTGLTPAPTMPPTSRSASVNPTIAHPTVSELTRATPKMFLVSPTRSPTLGAVRDPAPMHPEVLWTPATPIYFTNVQTPAPMTQASVAAPISEPPSAVLAQTRLDRELTSLTPAPTTPTPTMERPPTGAPTDAGVQDATVQCIKADPVYSQHGIKNIRKFDKWLLRPASALLILLIICYLKFIHWGFRKESSQRRRHSWHDDRWRVPVGDDDHKFRKSKSAAAMTQLARAGGFMDCFVSSKSLQDVYMPLDVISHRAGWLRPFVVRLIIIFARTRVSVQQRCTRSSVRAFVQTLQAPGRPHFHCRHKERRIFTETLTESNQWICSDRFTWGEAMASALLAEHPMFRLSMFDIHVKTQIRTLGLVSASSGALMISALYFNRRAQSLHSSLECVTETMMERLGRNIVVGLVSYCVAFAPRILLHFLTQRHVVLVPKDEKGEFKLWKRTWRHWRRRDEFLFVLYCAFVLHNIFVSIVFVSGVSGNDAQDFLVAALASLVQSMFIAPVVGSVMLSCAACWLVYGGLLEDAFIFIEMQQVVGLGYVMHRSAILIQSNWRAHIARRQAELKRQDLERLAWVSQGLYGLAGRVMSSNSQLDSVAEAEADEGCEPNSPPAPRRKRRNADPSAAAHTKTPSPEVNGGMQPQEISQASDDRVQPKCVPPAVDDMDGKAPPAFGTDLQAWQATPGGDGDLQRGQTLPTTNGDQPQLLLPIQQLLPRRAASKSTATPRAPHASTDLHRLAQHGIVGNSDPAAGAHIAGEDVAKNKHPVFESESPIRHRSSTAENSRAGSKESAGSAVATAVMLMEKNVQEAFGHSRAGSKESVGSGSGSAAASAVTLIDKRVQQAPAASPKPGDKLGVQMSIMPQSELEADSNVSEQTDPPQAPQKKKVMTLKDLQPDRKRPHQKLLLGELEFQARVERHMKYVNDVTPKAKAASGPPDTGASPLETGTSQALTEATATGKKTSSQASSEGTVRTSSTATLTEVQYASLGEELQAKRAALKKLRARIGLSTGELDFLVRLAQTRQQSDPKSVEAIIQKLEELNVARVSPRSNMIMEATPGNDAEAGKILASVDSEIKAVQDDLREIRDAVDMVNAFLATPE